MIISLTELMRTIQTEKSLVVDFPTMLPLLHLLNHLIVLVGLVIIYTLLSLPLNCLNFLVVGDGLVLIIESRVSLKMGIFSCTRRLRNNRNFCFLWWFWYVCSILKPWILFWCIALHKATGMWFLGCTRYLHAWEHIQPTTPTRIQPIQWVNNGHGNPPTLRLTPLYYSRWRQHRSRHLFVHLTWGPKLGTHIHLNSHSRWRTVDGWLFL